MKRKNKIILVILGSLVAIGVFLFSRNSDRRDETPKTDNPPIGAYATAEGFSYIRNVNGRVQWELKAAKVEYSEDQKTAVIKNVEAVFYDETDRSLRVNGETGRYFSDSQDVELEGKIKVATSIGYTLYTDKLVYTNENRLIESRSPVFVKGEGVSLNSENMKISVNDQKLELFGNVKSTIWDPKIFDQMKGQVN